MGGFVDSGYPNFFPIPEEGVNSDEILLVSQLLNSDNSGRDIQ